MKRLCNPMGSIHQECLQPSSNPRPAEVFDFSNAPVLGQLRALRGSV